MNEKSSVWGRGIYLLLILLIAVITFCPGKRAYGNSEEEEYSWWPTDATPEPYKDEENGGYWWWPKEPENLANDEDLWGNRGHVYKKMEIPKPAPQELGEVEKAFEEEAMEVPAEVFREEKAFEPVYFAFDSSDLTSTARKTLKSNAELMGQRPSDTFIVEGHCDERGTNEYNMALGERRANSARDYLISLGIPSTRLNIVSLGEEVPAALGHDEDAWSLNRRAEFRPGEPH